MDSTTPPQYTRNDSCQSRSDRSDDGLAAQKRRRIKSHRKSRGGCLMCKTRKVKVRKKCCEKKPRCANCVKMGDECVYGMAPERQQQQQTLVRLQSPQLSTTSFTLRDLRYFHSFITASYPSFPFETDRAWTCEIPLIAQQYGFLNDAILALGAGHLHATTNLDIADTVHKYRSSAIRGINSEDNFDLPGSKDLTASDRATAVLAAIYALAFTSLHMGDPIGHFMVLVRGCSSVTRRIVEAGLTSPLFPQDLDHLSPRPHMEVMRSRLGNASPLPTEVTEAARASLSFVEMSCPELVPFELDFLHRMQSVVAITSGPIEAFNHYTELWNLIIDMEPDQFEYFNGSVRIPLLVLQAHFLAFEIVLRPFLQASGAFVNGDSKLLRNVLQQFPREDSTIDAELSMQLISWPAMLLEHTSKLGEADLRRSVFSEYPSPQQSPDSNDSRRTTSLGSYNNSLPLRSPP